VDKILAALDEQRRQHVQQIATIDMARAIYVKGRNHNCGFGEALQCWASQTLPTRKQKPAEMNTKTKANDQRALAVSKEIRIEYEFATTMKEVQQRIWFLNLCGSCAPCARHRVGAPEASWSILNSGIGNPPSCGTNYQLLHATNGHL
jgi:hypothetical protein